MSDHALSHVLSRHTHTLLPLPVLQRQDEIERGLLPTLYSSMQALHQSMWHLTKGYKNGLKAYEIAGIASQRNVMAAVTCFRSLVLCSERGWGGNACRRWWGKKEEKPKKNCINFINMLTIKVPYRLFGSFLSIFVTKPLNKATVNVAIVTSGQSCYFGVRSTRAVISWKKM